MIFIKRPHWLWFLTLIVSVLNEDNEERIESARYLLSLTTIDTFCWAVGRMMIYEVLVLAESLGGTRRLIVTSLILTTAEVVAEFMASSLTPRLFILLKKEDLGSRNLSRFALEIYGMSSRVGFFAYSFLGLAIYSFKLISSEAGLFLLAVTQIIQYSIMNQIGDQAVELSRPHWLPTFQNLELGLLLGSTVKKRADAEVLSLYLSLQRISLSILLSGVYIGLRHSPLARFASAALLCLIICLASHDLLIDKNPDIAARVVDENCIASTIGGKKKNNSITVSSFPWPWRLARLDLKLIFFALCAFSLPEQALNALFALLVLRLSTLAFGSLIFFGITATIIYFVRELKRSKTKTHLRPRFTSWIRLITISLVGLALSAVLLFFVSTHQLVYTVAPALCLFIVAQWALRTRFTEFLFLMDQARSSTVVYYLNVSYVLASGPLLILNWILVQQVRGSDYVQVAVIVIAAGALFFFAALILACQTDLRSFVDAQRDQTPSLLFSRTHDDAKVISPSAILKETVEDVEDEKYGGDH